MILINSIPFVPLRPERAVPGLWTVDFCWGGGGGVVAIVESCSEFENTEVAGVRGEEEVFAEFDEGRFCTKL